MSNFGDATALRQVTEDGHFSPNDFQLEFQCEGTPPSFEAVFFAPKERPTWRVNFEVRAGTLHVPGRAIRRAEWQGRGYSAFATPLHRAEIESLAESAGALDIEIHDPDGETLRYSSPESSSIVSALSRFLVQCGRHVQEANRQFEIDGIHVDLQVEVDEKGIEDMRALAAELGIRDVKSIYVGLYGLPSSSLIAIVESRAVQDGDRIAQSELHLRHKDWQSSWVDPGDELTTRGSWQTSPRNLVNRDRWIIRDGDWFIEVRLEDGVPYDDAVRIIRAIPSGTLVDVREGPGWMYAPLSIGPRDLEWSAKTVPEIRVDDEATAGESGRYEVRIPSSQTILNVRVVGEKVEALSVTHWLV